MALALPTNIRVGWKRLLGSNTLAYWSHSWVMKKINVYDYSPIMRGQDNLINSENAKQK